MVDWNEAVVIIDERQLMQVVFSDMSFDHKIDHKSIFDAGITLSPSSIVASSKPMSPI